MSLVYVNGVEVSRRNSGGATATANGRVAALGVGAAIVAADQPQSPQQRARADVEGEGVGGFAGGLGIRAGDGAGIRLVGEMAISRPAYLQVCCSFLDMCGGVWEKSTGFDEKHGTGLNVLRHGGIVTALPY